MKDKPDIDLRKIKASIKSELKTIDDKLYSDSLITVKLEKVYKYLGAEAKDKMMDDCELEKYGWRTGDNRVITCIKIIHQWERTPSNP